MSGNVLYRVNMAAVLDFRNRVLKNPMHLEMLHGQ